MKRSNKQLKIPKEEIKNGTIHQMDVNSRTRKERDQEELHRIIGNIEVT